MKVGLGIVQSQPALGVVDVDFRSTRRHEYSFRADAVRKRTLLWEDGHNTLNLAGHVHVPAPEHVPGGGVRGRQRRRKHKLVPVGLRLVRALDLERRRAAVGRVHVGDNAADAVVAARKEAERGRERRAVEVRLLGRGVGERGHRDRARHRVVARVRDLPAVVDARRRVRRDRVVAAREEALGGVGPGLKLDLRAVEVHVAHARALLVEEHRRGVAVRLDDRRAHVEAARDRAGHCVEQVEVGVARRHARRVKRRERGRARVVRGRRVALAVQHVVRRVERGEHRRRRRRGQLLVKEDEPVHVGIDRVVARDPQLERALNLRGGEVDVGQRKRGRARHLLADRGGRLLDEGPVLVDHRAVEAGRRKHLGRVVIVQHELGHRPRRLRHDELAGLALVQQEADVAVVRKEAHLHLRERVPQVKEVAVLRRARALRLVDEREAAVGRKLELAAVLERDGRARGKRRGRRREVPHLRAELGHALARPREALRAVVVVVVEHVLDRVRAGPLRGQRRAEVAARVPERGGGGRVRRVAVEREARRRRVAAHVGEAREVRQPAALAHKQRLRLVRHAGRRLRAVRRLLADQRRRVERERGHRERVEVLPEAPAHDPVKVGRRRAHVEQLVGDKAHEVHDAPVLPRRVVGVVLAVARLEREVQLGLDGGRAVPARRGHRELLDKARAAGAHEPAARHQLRARGLPAGAAQRADAPRHKLLRDVRVGRDRPQERDAGRIRRAPRDARRGVAREEVAVADGVVGKRRARAEPRLLRARRKRRVVDCARVDGRKRKRVRDGAIVERAGGRAHNVGRRHAVLGDDVQHADAHGLVVLAVVVQALERGARGHRHGRLQGPRRRVRVRRRAPGALGRHDDRVRRGPRDGRRRAAAYLQARRRGAARVGELKEPAVVHERVGRGRARALLTGRKGRRAVAVLKRAVRVRRVVHRAARRRLAREREPRTGSGVHQRDRRAAARALVHALGEADAELEAVGVVGRAQRLRAAVDDDAHEARGADGRVRRKRQRVREVERDPARVVLVRDLRVEEQHGRGHRGVKVVDERRVHAHAPRPRVRPRARPRAVGEARARLDHHAADRVDAREAELHVRLLGVKRRDERLLGARREQRLAHLLRAQLLPRLAAAEVRVGPRKALHLVVKVLRVAVRGPVERRARVVLALDRAERGLPQRQKLERVD